MHGKVSRVSEMFNNKPFVKPATCRLFCGLRFYCWMTLQIKVVQKMTGLLQVVGVNKGIKIGAE